MLERIIDYRKSRNSVGTFAMDVSDWSPKRIQKYDIIDALIKEVSEYETTVSGNFRKKKIIFMNDIIEKNCPEKEFSPPRKYYESKMKLEIVEDDYLFWSRELHRAWTRKYHWTKRVMTLDPSSKWFPRAQKGLIDTTKRYKRLKKINTHWLLKRNRIRKQFRNESS